MHIHIYYIFVKQFVLDINFKFTFNRKNQVKRNAADVSNTNYLKSRQQSNETTKQTAKTQNKNGM